MQHRVIVLGAGYAGASAAGRLAKRLRREDVAITLVNAEPDFVERVRMHQVAAGQTLKVGVITVPGFYQDIAAQSAGDENYRSTTRDVRRLIDELKTEKIQGLVLDLRQNGGGYLPEATALTGLFVDRGPVVQLKDTTGGRRRPAL